jgi:localization factor PodJL
MPTATLNSAPIMPSSVLAPKSAKGSEIGKNAGLPDPLTTGAIGARPNTLSAVQAGAQAVAIKDMAEKGDVAAQFDYGARLAEGRGVNQDKGAAVGWFEKAAAQGLPQAQYRLGAIYEKGVGAPRDPAKARDYYEKAANQGNVRAMHNLAVILAEGVDGKPDYSAAAQWFRRAAEYGVRDSQFNLAILYARGMGAPQNLGQSYFWFAVAAQQGDEDAARKRDEVGAQLDAAALGAAKKQVADFHAKTPAPAVNEPPSATVSLGAAASAASAAVGKALSKI